MTQEKITPLRERMMEDMRIRGMGDKAQKSHIRAIKGFAKFLKRSPDTATPEELRAYQLYMTDTGVTASTFNTRIIALRFFFGMTCGRDEMKRFMQFRTQPRKLPVVFSVEEVSDILMATPGPGLIPMNIVSDSFSGFPWRGICESMSRQTWGILWVQRYHFEMTLTATDFAGWRGRAVTAIRRAAFWHWRQFMTAVGGPQRRGSAT